jgi:hypothetical protein
MRGVNGAVLAARDGDVAALLGAGSRALELDGDLVASRSWFDHAYRAAERAGDSAALAEAALGLSGLWVHEHRATPASVLLRTRLEQALAAVTPGSEPALRLRIRLAGESDYRTGGHAAILAMLSEARRLGGPVAKAEALSLAHHCLLGPEHGAVRRRLATELIGESHHTSRRSDLLMGVLWQAVDLFLAGAPHAERRLEELRVLLAERDHLAVGFVAAAIEVMLDIRAGRFAEAERAARVCAERGARAGDIDAAGWYGAQLVAIHWYQGRITELLPMLDELVHSPTLSAVDNAYFAALAVAAAVDGDRRQAAGAVATLCGEDLGGLPRSSSWLVTMHGVVEAAYLLDDAATAARAYALLEPFADLPVTASLGVACFGSVRHALGTAALTSGDLDAAVTHLGAAVRHNLALGHWPAVMMSRRRHAHALARRGRAADLAAARTELAAAVREAEALGIPVPAERDHQVPRVSCARTGRRWRIERGGRSVQVEHGVGMLHLAVLLANPGTEIPAVELAAGAGVLADSASPHAVLDSSAVRGYRRRLDELHNEIDCLEPGTELDRARSERDWLVAELAGATGLGGRTRAFADNGERARVAVGKAIRRAITRITEADPALGEHLRTTVHTGTRCSYRPT